MAGDDRPAGRQGVDELGVAVVDDVVDVERVAAREAAEVAGVVGVSVQEPVGVPRRPGQAAPREPAEPAAERRADPDRLDLAGVPAREVVQDHLGDEVHARPPLLGVVGDDRDAEGFHVDGEAVAVGRGGRDQAGAVG